MDMKGEGTKCKQWEDFILRHSCYSGGSTKWSEEQDFWSSWGRRRGFTKSRTWVEPGKPTSAEVFGMSTDLLFHWLSSQTTSRITHPSLFLLTPWLAFLCYVLVFTPKCPQVSVLSHFSTPCDQSGSGTWLSILSLTKISPPDSYMQIATWHAHLY